MSMSQITVQKGKNGEPDRERKVFYFENDKEKPILAAGILFVKEEDGNKFVLMQKVIKDDKQEQYSDFGGKIDKEDKTLIGTIARELGEELNYEETEQIDEISKNTLGNYIVKASGDATDNMRKASFKAAHGNDYDKELKKSNKRLFGI